MSEDESDFECEDQSHSLKKLKIVGDSRISRIPVSLGVRRVSGVYCPSKNTQFKRPALTPLDPQATKKLVAVPFRVVFAN
jgi:hypothetical protein